MFCFPSFCMSSVTNVSFKDSFQVFFLVFKFKELQIFQNKGLASFSNQESKKNAFESYFYQSSVRL